MRGGGRVAVFRVRKGGGRECNAGGGGVGCTVSRGRRGRSLAGGEGVQ